MTSSLDWIEEKFDEGCDLLVKEVQRFKNETFMQAIVAACAMVAAADNDVSDEEKEKMLGFIQRSDELKVFDIEEVVGFFNDMISNFQFDPAIGEAEALNFVIKIRDHPDQCELLIRVCIAIARSAGKLDESEKKAITELCKELNLNPDNFDMSDEPADAQSAVSESLNSEKTNDSK